MPKYQVMIDGKQVDEINSPNPIPSSALNDYASNNHHVKKLLDGRNVVDVTHGDSTDEFGSRTLTVVAKRPASLPTQASKTPVANPLIAAAQAKVADALKPKA